jgi:hypothetical protein
VQSALVDILSSRPMQLAARPTAQIAADLVAASNPELPNLTARLHGAPAAAAQRDISSARLLAAGAIIAAAAAIGAALWALLK